MLESIKLNNEITRRRFWAVNALLSIPLKAMKAGRNKKLWVFGCWEGQRYDDSSRYLYEYLLHECPEIIAIWITTSEKVYHQLKSQDKPVFLADSRDGRKYMLRAGVAFYSNGLDDFGNICYLTGALIVNLNHGPIAAKKLCYFNFERKHGIVKLLKIIKRSLFNWYYFDYTITTSELSKKFWLKAFCISDVSKFFISGLPRYDLICGEKYMARDSINFFRHEENYILYLPTFRLYDNSVVNDFVSAMLSSKQLCKLMEQYKYKIIIKPHYADPLNGNTVLDTDFIKVIDSNESISTQELLAMSSILITDYSSCSVDFAVTGKPVLLYTPDYEKYMEENGLSDEFMLVYKEAEIQKSASELIDRITGIITGIDSGDSISKHINKLFGNETSNPPYSKEVTEFVKSKLKETSYADK